MNMSVYSYMANNKKKWRAVYRYTDFTGKRRQTQKRGFNTKREAEFWLENKKKAENGQLNMTFGSFYEIYERDKKARVKETTFETKSYVARDKILPYFKDRRMDEIKPKDVMEWQNELLNYRDEKGEPYSSGYLRTIHAQLSAIFNFAKRYYGLSTNPAAIVGTMKNDVEKEVEIWTKEEYLKFSEAVMDKPLSFYAFEVLYWTGVREGELLALTPADFDFDNNTMRINKNYQKVKGREIITSPKTKKSNRVVKIPQFLADEIKDYMKCFYDLKPDQRLFYKSKGYLGHEITRGSKKAGIKRINIHALRHSHISLLMDRGFSALDIAERVGHEAISITNMPTCIQTSRMKWQENLKRKGVRNNGKSIRQSRQVEKQDSVIQGF